MKKFQTRRMPVGFKLPLLLLVSGLAFPTVTVFAAEADATVKQTSEISTKRSSASSDSLTKLREAALRDYAPAQFDLGKKLIGGTDGTKNPEEGLQWITRAAQSGHADAQFLVGLLNEDNGLESVKWYRLAADQDYPQAQARLGDCYRLGRGVPQNYAEAVRWYNKAADQEDIYSQYALGVLYENGMGMPKNSARATHWYRRALKQTPAFAAASSFKNGTSWPQKSAWAAAWARSTVRDSMQVTPETFSIAPPKGNGSDNAALVQALEQQVREQEGEIARLKSSKTPLTEVATVPSNDSGIPTRVTTVGITSFGPQKSSWGVNLAQLRIERGSGVSLEETYGPLLPENISSAQRNFLMASLYFDDCDVSQERYEAAQWKLKSAVEMGCAEVRKLLVRQIISDGKESSLALASRINAFTEAATGLARANDAKPINPANLTLVNQPDDR
ncbi:MAG: repeat protein subfamily [Pedosphaera sp.]|nr:repeat protein subfamily [Pedosphaera sp.]